MIHKKLLLGVIVLMVASMALVGVACCGNGDGDGEATPTPTPTAAPDGTPTPTPPPTGGAPTLKVGDTWTYTVNWKDPPEETSTFVGTVSSATAAGYEVVFVFDETERKEKLTPLNLPVYLLGEIIRTYNADLDILTQDIESEVVGYGDLILGLTITTTHTAAKWPLAAGKEWHEAWALMVGDNIFQDAWDYTVVVEGVEDVTVPAGTFECYKIVSTDVEKGYVRITDWFSEDVKASVKRIEEIYFHGVEIWELESYSVAP